MISSWKDFTYTVDQMRQLQKKGHIKDNPDLFIRLKKLEAEVDAVCDRKITEWNAQGDLFKNGGAVS